MMLQAANSDFTVIALLLIKSENFEYFISSKQEGCLGINPIILQKILDSHVGAEWSLTIHGNDKDRVMRFFFRNDTQGTRRGHLINLLEEAPYGRFDTKHMGWVFKAVVGIQSGDFQNNLVLLSEGFELIGTHHIAVIVFITHNQLKLSTVNKEVVLTKEIGECIIGGVSENDPPIKFSFSLEHMTACQNASLMSSMVWLLTPDNPECPYMLNCPVGSVGNIMFLFPP